MFISAGGAAVIESVCLPEHLRVSRIVEHLRVSRKVEHQRVSRKVSPRQWNGHVLDCAMAT